jgi:hypothetical protein
VDGGMKNGDPVATGSAEFLSATSLDIGVRYRQAGPLPAELERMASEAKPGEGKAVKRVPVSLWRPSPILPFLISLFHWGTLHGFALTGPRLRRGHLSRSVVAGEGSLAHGSPAVIAPRWF